VLDVRTSSSSTVLSRAVLDNLPLTRTVSGYVDLAPGVVKDIAFGSSLMANPLTLDGSSGNEPGWGTPIAVPSSSWIDEIQVVSLGADAQYGEYTGAPINALTRSGSNRSSGSIDFWTTASSWTADNRGDLPANLASRFRPLEVLDRWSTTAQAGGPIARDRAWFFAGLDLYRNANRPSGFAAIANPPQDAVASTHEPKWLGKATAAIQPGLRIEGFAARDASTVSAANASPTVKPEALSTNRLREWLWNARMTWVAADDTLFEFRHGGIDSHALTGPADPSGIAGPPPHLDLATNVKSGNVGTFTDYLARQSATAISVTHVFSAVHDVKAGFEFEHSRLRDETGYPGGMVFDDINGQPSTVIIQAPQLYRPAHNRETWFVQDGWQALPRVTLNVGVRGGFYQGAVDGSPTQFAARSIAPRAGVAWDLSSSHASILRMHFGRYHEAMVTSFYDFLDPLSQTSSIEANVTGPGQYTETSRDDPFGAYSLDPNIRYPYADEWLMGFDRVIGQAASLTAQYIGRRYGSIVGFVGQSSEWVPVQRQDPGPDGIVGTRDDGQTVTIFFHPGAVEEAYLTNPDGAYKNYHGVQLIASRRGSGPWHGQLSYTWSKTLASFDTAFSSNAANNDLSTNGVYVNPNRALNAAGRPSNDFTHELKAVGTLTITPWGGLVASGVYRYQTGVQWARAVRFAGPTFLASELMEVRSTREAPATNVLDLRLEKTFHAGSWRLGAYGDVFNAANQGVGVRFFNVSGPTFGTPLAWSDPRTLRVGMRASF